MNQHPGILGKKLGMTQLFLEDGTVQACTVVQGGCVVVDKRTPERDGYSALVVGLGERKDKHASKAVIESFKKRGQTPKRHVQELRCSAEYAAGFEIGAEIRVEDVFEAGQRVDVQARSKGSGFTGVMKRHNFSGAKKSHGAHETQRHAGSIGMATTPGRVLKGHKMAGQRGNKTLSVLNLKVAQVVPEKQLVLIEGGVPGAPQGVVRVRGAVKKGGGKPKSAS
ncbi:MAG: 50S ribosomal protein L3 [Deltaproteobacteria bacterium]|jgi:large subunit ribosomal protein L3|nr:50S ribosomal protein L3 [Deltaproteobacteria bacterium]MBW2536409.1 50S ribosomal protein L3 [Deltaproteobacteria bacterium]